MELQIGKVYRNRLGELRVIVSRTNRESNYDYLDHHGDCYMADGRWSRFSAPSDYDLVREAKGKQPPLPVGDYVMQFHRNRITVGCQAFGREEVLEIFKRLGAWLNYEVED